MAGYQAKIDVIISGLREVAALEGRLEQLQSTINAINKDPIDLNIGGRGRSRDLSGKLSKNVNDLVRNFDNFGKSFSSVSKQASLFGDLVSQTALKSTGEFKKQDVAVRNLATAYTTATNESARFERQQTNLIRTSQGLQNSTQREIELIKRRAKISRLTERKRRGEQLQQDILLGAGFPLLFGGGAGAVAGGLAGALAGGGKGGFGLQIFGSAVGQQIDALVEKASNLGKALNPLTFDLDEVANAAGIAGTETVNFLENIERYAGATEAARLATKLLETRIGVTGVKALQDFGKSAQTLGNNLSTIFTQVLANIVKVAGPLLANLGKFAGQVADVGAFKARTDLKGTEKLAQDILVSGLGKTGTGGLGVSTVGAGGIKQRAKALLGPNADLSDKALRQFAVKTAQESQRKFELPVLQEIETLSGTLGPDTKTKKTEKDKLPALRIKVGLQTRLLALDKQIAQAALDEDEKIKSILEKEKIRETLAASIDTIKTKGLKTEVEANEIELERLAAAKQIQDIDIKRAETEKTRAEKFKTTVEGLKQEGELLQARLDGNETEVALKQKITEATKNLSEKEAKRVEDLIQKNALLREEVQVAEQMKQIYEQIGASIKTGVVDSIQAAIDGTKSLAEVASNTLKNISNKLLDIGVNFALFGVPFGTGSGGGLLGGFFANGGNPPVGKPSIVGERGPELFVPRTSGTIVPNNQLGGATNIVVNVDAKGSNAQGGDQQGKQLGQAIGAAVQAELIKQKRPGGLLS